MKLMKRGRLKIIVQTALSGICWGIPAGFSLGLNHKQLRRARMPTLRIDV
ncbi:hypothetical protein [Neisseria animaloris]|nr:hypothetical protein [Neisseria animaloris]